MRDPFAIETADLRKSYDGVEAVRGLSLQVPAGSIYGFLGRNGAGKTTTIKVLLGMARPTSGYARVFSLEADSQEASVDIRRRTGFVSDEKDLYDYMTVEGMIRFTASFSRAGARPEQRYLRRFELPLGRKVKHSRVVHAPARVTAGAVPRRGAAHPRRADVGTRPRDDETSCRRGRPCRRRGDDGVRFVASDRRGGPDRRPRRHHRSRPRSGNGVARTIFGRTSAASNWCSTATRRSRRSAARRPARAPPGSRAHGVVERGAERIVDEARALNPVSVDVVPVTLKEIFLETVTAED